MKKTALILLCFIFVFSLWGCNNENTEDLKKSDETAKPFLEALTKQNYEEMLKYIHPDYTENSLPDEEWYNRLEKEIFFKPNKTLTAVTATAKNYITNTELEGELLECVYVIFYNELYYDVKIFILENEKGYGVVRYSIELCQDPTLLFPEEGE